ncbi:MAG: hypothetical protein AMJ90_00120 [candidate division Zixibacteria bacterium SM23_73_2]|nr:MAG: hypothetical protein AMJ90_00120 [candidate division Zixibacteria bacterium SM23_73_2]
MSDSQKNITRRDFIRQASYATLAVTLGLSAEGSEKIEVPKKTKVVLIRDPKVLDKKGMVNPKVIQKMLDQATCSLFEKEDPVQAWKLLIKPKDVVGIKSNVWGPLPTPKELEQAIKKRMMDAGVLEKNIGIDDRGVLRNKIFLNSTALVNVRPLRTHHWSGVGGCTKNHIMFSPHPPKYHPNSCEDLATVWDLPIVKGKTRLNILVLLTPLFHGIGPHHFDSTYMWDYKGMLVGTDPVALDAVGVRIFQAKRLAFFGEDRPLKPPPHHIVFADTKHKLGTSDMKKIELIKLGWKEDILI